MKKRKHLLYAVAGVVLCSSMLWAGREAIFGLGKSPEEAVKEGAPSVKAIPAPAKPRYVRGIHLTAWVSGSSKFRANLDRLLNETELNTAVIDIKEYEGEVYLPGFKQAEQYKTYVPAIPDAKAYIADLKSRGVYTVARLVVFKDNLLVKRKPEWAVKDVSGSAWKDRRGNTWTDPYNREVWDYNLSLAEHAADLGFQEIQFDYIRFPSDGNIKTCRYSQAHSSATAADALVGFLKEANRRLKPRGVNLSIDVFGLTTTVPHDMGIGQKITEMTQWVDYVSPMVYPSHYARGEYGIPDPNKAPYHTVYLGMAGAKKKLGSAAKLRPYLQDFSLGYRYGEKEVRDQIQACYDNDIAEWLLWNPRCVYTRTALKSKAEGETYVKKEVPEYIRTPKKPLKAAKQGTARASVAASTGAASAASLTAAEKAPETAAPAASPAAQ